MESSSTASRALKLTFALVVIGCSSALIAQVDRGNIVGTVSDPSGANVEGAKVLIRNLATEQSVEVTTDSSGAYAANLLRIGTYSVIVERQGFEKAVKTSTELGVDQVVRGNHR